MTAAPAPEPRVSARRASGGVVYRWRPGGRADVLVVHRPRYDDWSLPKGKADSDESDLEAACREVREETGVIARPTAFAGETRYCDARGRDKTVRYWFMATAEPAACGPVDPSEVDEARWVSATESAALLDYEGDRDLVANLADGLVRVLLVRHAKAGDRTRFVGDDRARPLSKPGRAQADALAARLLDDGRGSDEPSMDGVPILSDLPLVEVVSSPYVRCVQTVAPLAARATLPVRTDDRLAEGHGAHPILDLIAGAQSTTVLCSHGDVVGDALSVLSSRGVELGGGGLAKASVWSLDVAAGRVVAATYEPPPAVDDR